MTAAAHTAVFEVCNLGLYRGNFTKCFLILFFRLRSKLRKLKQQSLKKLSGFKLWSKNSSSSSNNENSNGPVPVPSEVNTTPNGITMTKLRASKSMQNLEQITRDSFYNLKDLSSNLRQKYNSRMELRQQSQMYNELWDENENDDDLYYRRYDY